MHWLDELDHQSELNTALRKALEVELPKQEARLEAKLKAEMEAKLKAEMEAKLKADLEAKCLAEGKAEEKLAIAKSLKENGAAPELITKSLGLTIEQVTKL